MNNVKLGVSSVLWNNPNGDAFAPWLREVKSLGYDGVAGFADWGWQDYVKNGSAFRSALADEGLELASLMTNLHVDFDRYRTLFEFMQANGCERLVCLGAYGKGERDYRMLGELMNYLNAEGAAYGVRAYYHNHTGNTGETLEDMRRLLAHADPALVPVMCDVGHATKDFVEIPVPEKRAPAFLREFRERLGFVEFKDWNETTDLNTPVGEGRCGYGDVFDFLREIAYEGWIVVEQNGHEGPSLGRAPGECARISRQFIRRGLGV